ncbi:unnamed protein product [Sphagnum balticum]
MNKMATPEAIDRIEENNKIRDLESKIYQDFVNQENGDLHEKKFIYVEGPDYYWVRPKWWFDNNPEWDSEGTFVRFRKPSYGLDNGNRQVTSKYKAKDAKSSIQRVENNIDIKDKTHESTIIKELQMSGYLAEILRTAIECVEDEDENPWVDDANTLLSTLSSRRIEFENHRFNQKNGHLTQSRSPFPAETFESIGHIDIKKEADLNAIESGFGDQMSEDEVANLFQEKPKVVKKKKLKPVKLEKMNLEEIESWEASQNNSNDIYKVSARIKNLARAAVKSNLTAQGDMVVNMFTHVIKNLYDFADTVPDKETKIKLVEKIRSQEEMPANLIAALGAGVRNK